MEAVCAFISHATVCAQLIRAVRPSPPDRRPFRISDFQRHVSYWLSLAEVDRASNNGKHKSALTATTARARSREPKVIRQDGSGQVEVPACLCAISLCGPAATRLEFLNEAPLRNEFRGRLAERNQQLRHTFGVQVFSIGPPPKAKGAGQMAPRSREDPASRTLILMEMFDSPHYRSRQARATERPSSGEEFLGGPAKSRSGVRLLSPELSEPAMHLVMSAFAFAFVFAVLAKFL